jgi:hypothetical protein
MRSGETDVRSMNPPSHHSEVVPGRHCSLTEEKKRKGHPQFACSPKKGFFVDKEESTNGK